MRSSMKGPDAVATGAGAKLTKNPSYDGKLEEVKNEECVLGLYILY